MKKSDKIKLLKELNMDEPTFYLKYGGPQDLAAQHPDLYFKYCMGGRKKYQTGGTGNPQNSLLSGQNPRLPVQGGLDPNNYSSDYAYNLDNTDNSKPQLNKSNNTNQYLAAASDLGMGIGRTVNNYNNAQSEQDKNRAITYGTIDTAVNIVGDFVPPVKMVKQAADTTGQVIDATNPNTTYIDKDGKQYSYKKGDVGTSATGFKAAVDPVGNVTNAIGDLTGDTENYGQNDTGMFFADMFAPYLSAAFRNKQEQKIALENERESINDMDSQAKFVGKYGGKLKFQEGGIPPEMMAAIQGGDPAAMQQAPQSPPPYVETWKDIVPSMKISSKLKPIEYKGRTHKYGGINVSDQSELEHGEYSVNLKDPQTGAPVRYIFSAETGFAARAKKIMSDYGPQYT